MAFLPELRRVAGAERIIPAADLSEQISHRRQGGVGHRQHEVRAQRRAHVGTLDGANIEIRDAVGPENFFLFGLTADEVRGAARARLRPARVHRAQPARSSEVLALIDVAASSAWASATAIAPIVDNLRDHDPFMVCADFDAYVAARGARRATLYRDPRDWSRRALFNIAGASALLERRDRSASTPTRSGTSGP